MVQRLRDFASGVLGFIILFHLFLWVVYGVHVTVLW